MEEDRTEIIDTPPTGARKVTEVRDAGTPRVTEVHSSTVVPRADVDHVEAVAYDPYEGRRLAAYRLSQLVYWVFGLIEGLIAIRLILKALGANPSAGFSEFIYGITAPLVAPFIGLFSNPAYQNSVLELSSIVGLIAYGLLAWLIAKLVWILIGETRSAIKTRSTQMDSRI
jgi:uncharacterized membrane protein